MALGHFSITHPKIGAWLWIGFLGFLTFGISVGMVSGKVDAQTVSPPQASASAPSAAPVFQDNFDGVGALSQRWVAQGPIKIARVPVRDSTVAVIPGVEDKMIRLSAQSRGILLTRPLDVDPLRGFAGCESIVFRIQPRNADPKKPLDFEVWFYSRERSAWRWRRVTLKDPTSWVRLELPLADFNTSPGAAVEYEETNRLGFLFRDKAEVDLDNIEVRPGRSDQSAYWSAEQLSVMAFGKTPAAKVRITEWKPFVILTNCEKLDIPAVMRSLQSMYLRTRSEFPMLPEPRRLVPLIVFAKESEYQAFWPRIAKERLNASIETPKSDGFSALGIATASCPVDGRTVRPVYAHEANHALMHQILGVSNTGEWFYEGLATRYQLEFMKRDLQPFLKSSFDGKSRLVPLSELLNGKPIGINRYQQAAAVLEWILRDPKRKASFGKALAEMRKTGSTNMAAITEKYFETPFPKWEEDWLEWGREQAGVKGRESLKK